MNTKIALLVLLLIALVLGVGNLFDERSFNVRQHMEILAADDMQGREAGTEGHQKAADYVASWFARAGLQALGDDDTYFQQIDLIETRLVENSASMVLHHGGTDTVLTDGEDFIRYGGFGSAEETVSAPMVFVGFGIRAPTYHHDDFAGVDVAGKILVEFTGAPPTFADNERAYYSSGSEKQAQAVEHGALGIVSIRTPVDQERLPWPRMRSEAKSAGMRWLDPDGVAQDGFEELTGSAALSNAAAEHLFGLAGKDLNLAFDRHNNGGLGSFELGVSASLSRRSEQRRVKSPNVLALLPGRDPELSKEYVLFSAHLDHLGIRSGEDDEIYNGAYDNAAGVAAVLELATALAKKWVAPRRSIIFAALTGEEKGLRGSDYLARNSPVPIHSIVANINLDMPYLAYPMTNIEGLGVEHSTLHGALIRATEQHKLTLTPDSHPELVRLIRSDQFSFVKQGVPGLNLKPGAGSSDPEIDGEEGRNAFLKEHYHQPSDDLNLPFSEEGAIRFVEVALALGLIVANDDDRPRWKEGDFFGERFGSK